MFTVNLLLMSHNNLSPQLPAPCIIDAGMIINKDDMRRLLNDLGRVRYQHWLDGKLQSEGEGWVVDVFSHPQQATLVANHTLYLNIHSFDYLELHNDLETGSYFDLVQDNRQLRLVPLSSTLQDQQTNNLDTAALEAMVTQVLTAKWDVQLDDDYPL